MLREGPFLAVKQCIMAVSKGPLMHGKSPLFLRCAEHGPIHAEGSTLVFEASNMEAFYD
jgi:hypothetical protein